MWTRRRMSKAMVVAMIACASVSVEGRVQVDPVVRLGVQAGYDSNVLYDGEGGDDVGIVSPDLGIRLRAPTWRLALVAGGDLVEYRRRHTSSVWNQRGALLLDARFDPRHSLYAEASATYAADPIGLARLGIFGRTGSALIGRASARLNVHWNRRWRGTLLFSEHLVRFDGGSGAASHEPGIEVMRRITRRVEVGGGYRFDYFQGLGEGARDAMAHELQLLARWRCSRRLTLEGELGPAIWQGPDSAVKVLPQAALQLFWRRRDAEARFSLRHGVGLGNLAVPGLFDSVEAALAAPVGNHFKFTADGGLWRSGDIPWGANGVLGYGVEGEFAWLIGDGFRLGATASRFARADTGVTIYDRNIVGLRFVWEYLRR